VNPSLNEEELTVLASSYLTLTRAGKSPNECGRSKKNEEYVRRILLMEGVELLRSKFKRSTQKLSFMLTENYLGVEDDIEDCALYVKISCLLSL